VDGGCGVSAACLRALRLRQLHPDGSYDTVWLHPARSAQSQMENEKWKSPMTLLTPADYAYAKDAGMLGLRR
jgi:hypothetical protein